MQLEPRQLSTLDEMGIPVWELRNQLISSTSAIAIELDEKQINADFLIVYDSDNHTEQKQQLLAAMMAAIDININATSVVRYEQFQSLKSPGQQSLENKLLFVFGKRFRTEFLSKQKSSNEMTAEVHCLKDSRLNIVFIDDLSELIQQPEKKQLAWQTLKCAKATVKRFN
jgi:DNA polymerase III psi subunit